MIKKDYNKLMEDTISGLIFKPKLLLHCCCAPCACGVLNRLKAFDVTLYFYNPNINSLEEYNKRAGELKKIGDYYKIIIEPYKNYEFNEAIAGYETEPEQGKRCDKCIELRIYKTAITAKLLEYNYFCSTLSVSPHKNAEKINMLGEAAANKIDINFLPNDFKKKDGFFVSTLTAKQLGLYRQNYCGCVYSKARADDAN